MNPLADIYFLNAEALAMELRNGTLSEHRAVKHLIASLVIGGVGFEVPVRPALTGDGSSAVSEVLGFILSGVVCYYGIWLLHQVNAKGDGKEFFLRFSVLTLPVAVQLILLFAAIGAILLVVISAISSSLGAAGSMLAMLLLIGLILSAVAMYFLRMRKYLAIAAGYQLS